MANQKETHRCFSCNKDMAVNLKNYYNHNNSSFIMNQDIEILPMCKVCINTYLNVEPDKFKERVVDILRLLNRPFIEKQWMLQGERWSKYIRYISSMNNGDKTFDESVFESVEKIRADVIEDTNTIEKWGEGYSNYEYKNLERFYNDMKESYEIDTASHRDYLKKICKASLKMDNLSGANGNVDEWKKVSDVYDKLMHSAKFTAVQRSAADKTGGMNTFSEFSEFAEKKGFVPKFIIENPDIVDSTMNNMKTFTKRLVLNDPNLANIVENSIQKMVEKEAEIDSAIDEEESEQEDFDIYLDEEDEDPSNVEGED